MSLVTVQILKDVEADGRVFAKDSKWQVDDKSADHMVKTGQAKVVPEVEPDENKPAPTPSGVD
jgi:hypothetical protein